MKYVPPTGMVDLATSLERQGWHGLLVPDSECLSEDVFTGLTIAALSTTRLKLGTGVTNPYTRHPAVTAGAIASLDKLSGGRAVLGVGRGDSSLAHLGLAPAAPDVFERFLRRVKAYLAGEAVPFDVEDLRGRQPVSTLGLAGRPTESRLHWLEKTDRRVPLEVAATGPRVIRIGARIADRLLFGLGADHDRLAWGIDLARKAREEDGLDSCGLSLAAFVNVVPHPNRAVARRLASGGVTAFSRFSVMHGKPVGPVDFTTAQTLGKIAEVYRMNDHGRHDAPHATVLPSEHIDRFGIVGTPNSCIQRLRDLEGLGIDRAIILTPFGSDDDPDLVRSHKYMADEVLPAFA
ncbi:MAG: LLM class flavin-dependent oxidoreductase [Actinomycetota bacterium]|nr:LLM class flavin-dependent oxidoreductase [Actinomycetota bacterium]